jgi:hypothetical protein
MQSHVMAQKNQELSKMAFLSMKKSDGSPHRAFFIAFSPLIRDRLAAENHSALRNAFVKIQNVAHEVFQGEFFAKDLM